MNRREMMRVLTQAGVVAVVPGLLSKSVLAQNPVRYEVHGSGPFLFLGPPIIAAQDGPGGDPLASGREGYLARLTDSYRVVVMDYPPTGADAQAAVDGFTPDRVCEDILAVADAAGAERFAWYGYSWGGVVGLHLASRTTRLTALVCGGWPPLGASYARMATVCEALAERGEAEARLFVTYYRGLEQWSDHEAVSKFMCPRMVFAGTDDVIVFPGYTARIGPLVAEHRDDLEKMGWTVRLVDGYRHDLFTRPQVVTPLIRSFLDPILLRG